MQDLPKHSLKDKFRRIRRTVAPIYASVLLGCLGMLFGMSLLSTSSAHKDLFDLMDSAAETVAPIMFLLLVGEIARAWEYDDKHEGLVDYVNHIRSFAIDLNTSSKENFAAIREAVAALEPIAAPNPPVDILTDYQTDERPLGTKERNVLLVIIAVLCREAKLDYSKPAKTAALIQGMAASMGVSIGETTIENHLKKIPSALETRMK